jgi:tRNA-dihydrouridine synthase 3
VPETQKVEEVDFDAATDSTVKVNFIGEAGDSVADASEGEPLTKKLRLSGAQKKAAARERDFAKRKEKKGMNKNRRFISVQDQVAVCKKYASGDICESDTG